MPNPFMISAASFPAAAETGAAAADTPASSAAPEPIRAPSQGAFAGSDITSDGRNIAGHAAKQRSEPGKAGECGSIPQESTNSVAVVMLVADTAAIDPVREPVAAVPINVVQHNPITHAVEVRPIAEPAATIPAVTSAAVIEHVERAAADPQDLIDEIFIGARRLQPRELPPDFHARLLEAIESDEIWADEAPLFLRKPL